MQTVQTQSPVGPASGAAPLEVSAALPEEMVGTESTWPVLYLSFRVGGWKPRCNATCCGMGTGTMHVIVTTAVWSYARVPVQATLD